MNNYENTRFDKTLNENPLPVWKVKRRVLVLGEDAPTNQIKTLSPWTRVYGGLGHFSSAPGRSREA